MFFNLRYDEEDHGFGAWCFIISRAFLIFCANAIRMKHRQDLTVFFFTERSFKWCFLCNSRQKNQEQAHMHVRNFDWKPETKQVFVFIFYLNNMCMIMIFLHFKSRIYCLLSTCFWTGLNVRFYTSWITQMTNCNCFAPGVSNPLPDFHILPKTIGQFWVNLVITFVGEGDRKS